MVINLFSLLIIILLVLILDRLSYLAYGSNISVSRESFLQSVRRMDGPVVLVTERIVSWVLGPARREYTCAYKNHRLWTRSFSPLDLPPGADVIRIRRW